MVTLVKTPAVFFTVHVMFEGFDSVAAVTVPLAAYSPSVYEASVIAGRGQSSAAAHPATAHFIATKLVRAFIADVPPPDLVASVAKTFRETRGDLSAVAKALVSADASWLTPMEKLRLPQEYLFAAARGLGVTPKPPQLLKALATLGQPLFNPPSPEGFHDDAATWLAPDAMTNRLDIAQNFAQQADAGADARQLADAILGDRQSAQTRETIAHAEGRVQGLTILLMSPEFQRR